MKTKILIVIALGIGAILSAFSQSAIVSAGGNATGNGMVSYSVGQTAFMPIKSSKGNVEPGVQHTYEITVVGMFDEMRISLRALAYPNPTSDFLQLQVDDMNIQDMQYTIYNLMGQPLFGDKITGKYTSIDMRELQPGIYILHVTDGIHTIKTLRIVKK